MWCCDSWYYSESQAWVFNGAAANAWSRNISPLRSSKAQREAAVRGRLDFWPNGKEMSCHNYAACVCEHGPTISDEARQALQFFHQFINMDVPRTLSLVNTTTWFVFTDASYEPQQPAAIAGIGAVLVDQFGKCCGFISLILDEDLLQRLNTTNRKTIIFEWEFFAIFIVMHCWSDKLCNLQVVVCTDNEDMKDILIACQISSTNATPVLCAILQFEFELKWNAWFGRVPIESNRADNPSRGQIQKLLDNSIPQYNMDFEKLWTTMLWFSTRGGLYQHRDAPADKKGIWLRGQLQELKETIRQESDLSYSSCSECQWTAELSGSRSMRNVGEIYLNNTRT